MALTVKLTYALDVAPHLRRALSFRVRRLARQTSQHEQRGRARWLRIVTWASLLFWGLVAYAIYSL